MMRLALTMILASACGGCSGSSSGDATASEAVPPSTATAALAVPPTASSIDPRGRAFRDSRAARLIDKFRNADDPGVLVVAHRGDWHAAPENSLAAIESCIALGVDMVEIDIRPTRDGKLVLMHDKTLERTTTGAGKVSNHSLAELQQLQLKDHTGKVTGERIPSLEAALEASRGRILVYLDKSELIIPAVFEVVERLQIAEQVFFYGGRPLAELEKDCGAVLKRINYLPKIGDETPHLAAYVLEYRKRLNPPAFVISFADPGSPVLGTCGSVLKQGTRVWASPLSPEMAGGRTDEAALSDPDGNWGWLMAQGASILCTDRPRELLAYLRKQGRHE